MFSTKRLPIEHDNGTRRIYSLPSAAAFLLLICSLQSPGQPLPYQSRAGRSYLVNYGAIGGDRFLATFAAKRFALVDEGSRADISALQKENPDLPILKYRAMVDLHSVFPEYEAINPDEYAFMHCGDPASMSIFLRGDTASVSWLADRRPAKIAGYRIETSLDSSGSFHRLGDSLITATTLEIRLPKSAVWIRVNTILEDGKALYYGTPVRIQSSKRDEPAFALRSVSCARSPGEARIRVKAESIGDILPDSLVLFCDFDRNNSINYSRERLTMSFDSGLWSTECVVAEGDRNFGGYEFFIYAFKNDTRIRLPYDGAFSTNINNRIMNDYYGFYVMNAGSSTWRQESIKAVLDAFAADGYNGLFEDDTWYRIERWSGDSYPPIAYNDSAWRDDMYEFLDSIRTVIHPRPAYFNGLYASGSDSLLLHADGGMTEGFAYTHWSGAQSGSAWKTQAEIGLRCTRVFNKTWMALGGAPQNDTEGRLYTLSSYLLVADTMSMYANATSYQEFAHFPEFDIPLGRALTTVRTDIDTLLLPASAGTAPCYAREYEHATVVVNPHAALPALYAGANGRMRLACTPGSTIDGSRIETIPATDTIPPKSARIYLNAGSLASPSIDSIEVFPQPARADDSTIVTLRALLRDVSHEMYRSDPSLPLYVTADLGKLGGPKELRLVNDGSPASGTASWYEGSFAIPYGAPQHGADVPVTAFSTTGLAAVRYKRIEVSSPDSSNLLLNFSFEFDDNEDGTPDNWKAYVKGFVYDTLGANAVTGRRSIYVGNDSLNESRGVYASITLKQPFPRNLEVSGWSKSIGVSEPKNNDYSIYVDVWYDDGTPLYGQCARFNTGTHDWEYSSRVIRPEKPIKNISVYVIFRGHTGEAWFDHIAVRPYSEPGNADAVPAASPLLELFPPSPNPARHSAALRFELSRPANLELRLHDALGRLVMSRSLESCSPGSHTTELELGNLAPGIYCCSIHASKLETRTVTVVVR